ncbi:MAG: PIG-L family deacetylase [Verrucomicrobia bacterium Tous-C9LFEB]|nr:MAG: PIG-L family deacetylase [Verrucomicrobia bacterium Tous-C9LFEB]
MQFSHPRHDVHVPDGLDPRDALIRTTHLAIAAHQDDIEIMAYHGIAECYDSKDKWFSGVVVTNGAGSPRAGAFAQYTDEQMQDIRRREQRKAADIGKYSIQLQLAHPSGAVKDPQRNDVRADLRKILEIALPKVVYLHNPADKHDTHVAVFLRGIEALRSLPAAERPEKVYGCEVWRDLDWLLAEDKRALAVNARPELATALLEVFESQIAGGKRYDLAAVGRRLANATFAESHATDTVNALTWAMDLTPLLVDNSLDPTQFTLAHLDRLKADVAQRLQRFS